MLKKFFYILATIALLVIFWFFFVKDYREKRMTKEGNILVKKIEIFKHQKGRLPASLEELGYEVKSGTNEMSMIKKSPIEIILLTMRIPCLPTGRHVTLV